MSRFALLLVATALGSCGDGEPPLVKETPVGSWRLEDPGAYAAFTVRRVAAFAAAHERRADLPPPPKPDAAQLTADMEKHVSTFTAEGAFEDRGPGGSAAGRWRREGNVVHVAARPHGDGPEILIELELTPEGFFLVAAESPEAPIERFRLVRTGR